MNNFTHPLVSVIIPFFNRIGMTMEAVESVFAQTFQDFEVVLVNDGSTEDISLLSKINDSRIQIINQENLGPATARNAGSKIATGKYIAFLDSDDIFLPQKLETQIEVCEKNPDVNLFHTSYYFLDLDTCETKLMNSGIYGGNVFPKIFYYCPIATPTVIIRRAVFEMGIHYEEKYNISEDIIFYSKIANKSEILGLDLPLTIVRGSNKSHAYNDKSQITGYLNILDYMESTKALTDDNQEREVKGIIYNNLAFHSIYISFLNFIYYEIKAFIFSKSKIRTIIRTIKLIILFWIKPKMTSLQKRVDKISHN